MLMTDEKSDPNEGLADKPGLLSRLLHESVRS
jgi:hypothetical protein